MPLALKPASAQDLDTKVPPAFHVLSEAEKNRTAELIVAATKIYVQNPTRAVDLLHQAMRLYETSWGPDHPATAGRFSVWAFVIWGSGWFDGAEELSRRALAINEKHFGFKSGEMSASLSLYARILQVQNKPEQAETVYRAALAIDEEVAPDSLGLSNTAFQLGKAIATQGRFGEAQPFFDRSFAVRAKLEGPTSPLAALGLQGVGENLYALKRYAEAEAVLSRAARIPRNQFNTAPKTFPEIMTMLGRIQMELGRTREADASFTEAVALTRAALAKGSWYSGDAEISFGRLKRRLGQPGEAVALLRAGCSLNEDLAQVSRPAQRALTQCMKDTALALRSYAAKGGGRGGDIPATLRAEAFDRVQYAELFESGYALARYGARIEATARGAGAAVQAYDEAQRRYNRFRLLYDNSFTDSAGAGRRSELQRSIDSNFLDMMRSRNQIRLQSPIYWELLEPSAIPIATLQASNGNNAKLLRDDEALVVFMIPPGSERGLVFAVSKTEFDWAETSLTGESIASLVSTLRAQIDRRAYGTSVAETNRPFDRQAAFELYRSLFGDPKIASIIATKSNLLIVPSGALTSLPPGLLITAPPPGGRAGDGDPAALRATKWLLRDKALTILPSVASLKTLRQVLPARQVFATTPDRLLAFADPDFAGASYGYPPPPQLSGSDPTLRGRPRAVQAYFRGEQPLALSLRTLDRLVGTGREAEAVRLKLGAPKDSVYLWNHASETTLRRLQASGELARAQVVEFATHGLISGDFELAQPALALAAPAPDADPALDDGLLTAAEAANLDLNANWVILSACNTAAPDAPDAQGLSGLVRGFFYAGARSLLISHWRVRDDVAPILIPDILARLADGRAKTKADALRQAALAILDDVTRPDFASPFAWAPFVLVGETAE